MIFPILLFLGIEIFNLLIYEFISSTFKISSSWKILRDSLTLGFFLAFSKILNKNDLILNFKIILGTFILLLGIMFFLSENTSRQQLEPYSYFQVLVFSPIVEELICRKIILMSFKNGGHLILGFIISSAIFIILHFNTDIKAIIFFTTICFVFSFVQLKTNSIANVITLHFLANLIIILASHITVK